MVRLKKLRSNAKYLPNFVWLILILNKLVILKKLSVRLIIQDIKLLKDSNFFTLIEKLILNLYNLFKILESIKVTKLFKFLVSLVSWALSAPIIFIPNEPNGKTLRTVKGTELVQVF